MIRNEQLRQACEAWLRAALPVLDRGEGGHLAPEGLAESWTFHLAFLDPNSEVSALPENDTLLTIVAEQDELRSALLVNATGTAVPVSERRRWLLHEYLKRFARVYLERTRSFSFQAEAFVQTYDQLEQFIYDLTAITLCWLVQFRNLAIVSAAIELAPGVVLRQVTDAEQSDALRNPLRWTGDLSLVARAFPLQVLLEIHEHFGAYTTIRDFSSWQGLEAPTHAVGETVLRALRLADPNWVALGPTQLSPSNPFLFFLERSWPAPAEGNRLAPNTQWYIVTPDHEAELGALYDAIKRPTEDPRLSFALTRLDDSYGRRRPEDQLVDYWIALETLFAYDSASELKFRACLRIARLIGETKEERQRIFEGLRKSYDLRSHVVHGGDPTSKKWQQHPGVVEQTGDVVRRSLRWCLDHGESPQLQDIDRQFLA